MTTKRIVPHLWFDKEAKEAATFYTSVFPRSRITNTNTLHDTPSGDVDVVSFELAGHPFMAISAGPEFTFNPSISFFLNFDPSNDPKAREKLDAMWDKLASGGKPLMPLDAYPFSERFGWVQDKYGLSWQLVLAGPKSIVSDPKGEARPFIVPSLMFVGPVAGRAEEAIKLYTSVFKGSKQGTLVRHGPGKAPDKEGTIMFADFKLGDQWFAAMDSAHEHQFNFNEAISLLVHCDSQDEIDHYWKALSAVPEAEQCGWLKDEFGVSWQITPVALGEMMRNGSPEQVARVTQAFLEMKKLDVAALRRAYEGSGKARSW